MIKIYVISLIKHYKMNVCSSQLDIASTNNNQSASLNYNLRPGKHNKKTTRKKQLI